MIAETNPQKYHQPQRHFGKIGDSQHGQIVKRIEVVLSDAAHASPLLILNLGMRQPDFRDHPAKVRIRIDKLLAQDVHDCLVVQAKSGVMGQHVYVRQSRHQAVVRRAYAIHKTALVAGILDGGYDWCPFLPFPDHVPEQLRWVLQVGVQDSHGVPLGLQKGVHGRT